jgi:hypothetical protein
MRFLVLILVAIASLPSVAQERVFRASSIDVEQDKRLDSVEQRVSVLEAVPVSQPPRPQVQPAKPKQQYAPANMVSKPAAKPTKSTKPYAVITIETLPGCAPCEQWKANEARELRAQGWTVIEAPLTSASSAPFFRICIGDKCYTHSGFMSHGVLRGYLRRVGQVTAKSDGWRGNGWRSPGAMYSTAELRVLIQQARPGGWQGPVYADVAPSYVKQHLVEPKHGFRREQVNGLTTEEALILHDLAPTHGNQIFPTR